MNKAVPNLQIVLSEPTKVGNTTRTGDPMGDIVRRMLVTHVRSGTGILLGWPGRSRETRCKKDVQGSFGLHCWQVSETEECMHSLYRKVDVSPAGVKGWWAVVFVGDPDEDNYAAGAASNQIHA